MNEKRLVVRCEYEKYGDSEYEIREKKEKYSKEMSLIRERLNRAGYRGTVWVEFNENNILIRQPKSTVVGILEWVW